MFGVFRFILAFNVVAFHIAGIPTIGAYAVYSFFILSGFLMTTVMHKTYEYSIQGFKKYTLNRLLRLYPAYWLLLIISFLAFQFIGFDFSSEFHTKIRSPETITDILANLFMVFPEYRPVEYPVRLAPATWALTIELFYYLMIGLGISKNATLTNIWFAISCIYVLINMFIFENWVSGYGNIVSASLPFSLGAMLFYHKQTCYSFIKKISNQYAKIILVLFTLNVIISSLSGIYLLDIHWKIAIIGTYLNLGLSSLLIIVLLFDGKNLLNRDIDQFLGDLSYPIYIFHFSGALIASWLIFDSVERGLSINGFITFLFGSLITIIVSVIVNITINKNIKRIRTLIKNKKEVVKQTV